MPLLKRPYITDEYERVKESPMPRADRAASVTLASMGKAASMPSA